MEVLGKSDIGKPATGNIVILAVRYPAVAGILSERGNQLSGKIVVDITNPINFETFDSLTVPADGSATEEIAEALPTSRVVKAFNTNFVANLTSGKVGDTITTTLLAGDDSDAKSVLAKLIAEAGLRAIDAGKLKRARELESMGLLLIALAANETIPWTGGFELIRNPRSFYRLATRYWQAST